MNKEKIHKVMAEFKKGTLKSGSGKKVKARKQAMAIAMAETRRKEMDKMMGSMHKK